MSKAMRFILLMACIIFSVAAVAVPIRRDTTVVMQPDGSYLQVTVTGDEYGWCHITTDGIAIVRSIDGSWRYASDFRDGSLVPSTMTAHDRKDRTPSESAWISSSVSTWITAKATSSGRQYPSRTYAMSTRSAETSPYVIGDYPRTGFRNCLIVLVDFPDRQFSRPADEMLSYYNDMFNTHGFSEQVTGKEGTYQTAGSVRDYFEAQSFGQFSPSFKVIGPVRADSCFAYYGKNRGGQDSRATGLAREICQKVQSLNLADISDYDIRGTGEVDLLGMIYAGRGENYKGSDPNTIWPHKNSIEGNFGTIRRVNYFMTCELFWDSDDVIDGIGTFCHEFSHILGLPDFYNANQDFILGKWSIMDYGTYTAECFVPSGYTAFERSYLGWMELTDITDPGTYWLDDVSKGLAYRMSTDNPDRFLILESHNREGWFKYQDADGLMLTQVNYDGTWNIRKPNENKKRYSIIPADNSYRYDDQQGDLYPFEGNDSVTWYSKPVLAIDGQAYQGLQLFNIRYSNGEVSFTLGTSIANSVTSPASEISIESNGSEINVTAPAGTTVGLYDLSGNTVISMIMSSEHETLNPPYHGIWIIRCGGVTRKISY